MPGVEPTSPSFRTTPGLTRREALKWTAGAALLAPGAASAQTFSTTAIQAALGEGTNFNQGTVLELAKLLAKKPYNAPATDLPEPFGTLTYEQYISIRALPNTILWNGENRGFTVEPLHRGFAFQSMVSLYMVEDGTVRRIGYDRGKFDYGRLQLPQQAIPDLGFSGFRIFGDGQAGRQREVAIFQGASFFRSSARGQNLGVMARGLTLKAGDPKGEEFPLFRAYWIEQPGSRADSLVIHALLDSESVTGAYRFTLRPGDVTIIDTEVTLCPRAPVENYGIAGMTTTYLFGPNDRRGTDDVRPAVYESAGLQLHNGNDEWIWRPLHNPETLQISGFVDPSPKGFGLIQRDRDYTAFLDDDQNFERRPSLWIEPIGDWAPGLVQLLEIPTDNEINDNVLAYWRPKQPLAAGSEANFAYRQFWCWQPPERPGLVAVSGTRVGRGRSQSARRIVVDFMGDALKASATVSELKALLSATPGMITNLRVWPYPERKLCRVGFDLEPGSDIVSELRLVLEAGGKPLSETWLYRWTP